MKTTLLPQNQLCTVAKHAFLVLVLLLIPKKAQGWHTTLPLRKCAPGPVVCACIDAYIGKSALLCAVFVTLTVAELIIAGHER